MTSSSRTSLSHISNTTDLPHGSNEPAPNGVYSSFPALLPLPDANGDLPHGTENMRRFSPGDARSQVLYRIVSLPARFEGTEWHISKNSVEIVENIRPQSAKFTFSLSHVAAKHQSTAIDRPEQITAAPHSFMRSPSSRRWFENAFSGLQH